MKGSGGYKVINNKIYVYGVVNGKRYRLSTGKKADKENLNWIRRNYWGVLLQLIDKKQQRKKHSVELKKFCFEVIEMTSYKRDANTQKDYISKLNRLIVPYFKSYRLEDIKPFDIEKWQNILLQKYSTTTVRRARNIFNMVLKKAVANDMISKNPIEYADNIQVRHKKREPYSIEEMITILNNAQGWLKIFLYLAFTTGLRPGELVGLQWDDIDFEKRIIYLKRSISKGVIKISSPTKNHNRIVIIANFVIDMLKKYKEDSKKNIWMFPSKLESHYYSSKEISERHFKPLLKKLGIKWKTLYATRHTYISIMRNAGVSSDFITEIVGHSKEVEDKHYYTAVVNSAKIDTVNNVFFDLNLDTKGIVRA